MNGLNGKLKSADFIKFVNVYLRDYDIKSKSWSEIMKNNDIPIELRNLLNGVRYIFAEELYDLLQKNNEHLIIYPTGSKNLTSDIDVQINININKFNNKNNLKILVNNIIKYLNEYKKLWKIESIERVLDINFYPPTILNYVLNKTSNKYVYFSSKQNNKYITLWKPQLNSKELIDEFTKKELDYLKVDTNTNTKKYYKLYNNVIIDCFFKLINCYKNTQKLTDKEFNSNLLCLIQYNAIGPEMYKTYSSILLVVWHLQMKNNIPLKLKQICSKIAYKENNELYKLTKKQKYKDRYLYCKMFF